MGVQVALPNITSKFAGKVSKNLGGADVAETATKSPTSNQNYRKTACNTSGGSPSPSAPEQEASISEGTADAYKLC